MQVVYYQLTQFQKTLSTMNKSGGVPQQAARKVREIIGAASLGTLQGELHRLTKNGEGRIKHCVKYDLPGHHRLVCTFHNDILTFLFVGNHTECDRWLDENRGLTPIIDKKSGRIAVVTELDSIERLPPRTPNFEADAERLLLDDLAASDVDLLPLSRSATAQLAKLTASASDEELQEAAALAKGDAQLLILNILFALRDGNSEGAAALLSKFHGHAITPDQDAGLMSQAITSEINSDTVVNLRDFSEIEIDHLFTRASFREWLTFLHPDQKRLASATFSGPAVLAGVSGSGKTSVLVHRARYLANKFPDQKILVLTLNKALAQLIASLVTELCAPSVQERISVKAISDMCEEIVRRYDPKQHLLAEDLKSGEDLEDCWDDSFAKDEQQDNLDPILRSLRTTHELDAVRYIRDEFIWIRSGLYDRSVVGTLLPSRGAYVEPDKLPREGRSIAFSSDWRKRALRALDHYEEHMRVGGFVDAAALSLEAHRFIDRVRADFNFRSVLVDEMQDFGSIELEIVRALAPQAEDGLLLAGDANQQVFPKSHSLASAGIVVSPGDRRYLRKNYRNTKQILEAGLNLLKEFGRTDLLSETELRSMAPQLSVREGPRPLAVSAWTEDAERRFVARYVNGQLKLRPDAPVGVVVCGVREDNPKHLARIRQEFAAIGLPMHLLTQDSGLLRGGAYLASMEMVKGFEFSTVVIVRCSRATLPDRDTPADECWREARRLYVAMTRGRDEVLFTYSGQASDYLEGMRDVIQRTTSEQQGL